LHINAESRQADCRARWRAIGAHRLTRRILKRRVCARWISSPTGEARAFALKKPPSARKIDGKPVEGEGGGDSVIAKCYRERPRKSIGDAPRRK